MDLHSLKAELAARGEIRLALKVVPRSSRTEFAGSRREGVWKVRVQAPPEKGKANTELCRFLAAWFGVSVRQVELVSGRSSTLKHVRILRD